MRILLICICFLHLSTFAYGREPVKWVFTDYPPANYRNAEGQYTGFLHDIVIEVFERRLGVAVEIDVYPWKRCQVMVNNGAADMMVTIPTPQRLEYSVTHEKPVWVKRRILFTYNAHPKIDSINGIKGLAAIKDGGYTVVSYLGNGWVQGALQDQGIPVRYATTVKGMYRMLSAKRGDLIVEEKNLALPLIKDLGLTEAIAVTDGIASESGFHILVGKKSAYAAMISRINEEIERMRADGVLDRIISRYDIASEALTGVRR